LWCQLAQHAEPFGRETQPFERLFQ
jgi:hypothetical protein